MHRVVKLLHCSTQALGCWCCIPLNLLPLSFLLFSFSTWVSFLTLIVTFNPLRPLNVPGFSIFPSFCLEAILRNVRTILLACGAFTSCWQPLRICHALHLLLYSWRAPAAKLLILPSGNLLPTSVFVFSLSLWAKSIFLFLTFTCVRPPKSPASSFSRNSPVSVLRAMRFLAIVIIYKDVVIYMLRCSSEAFYLRSC